MPLPITFCTVRYRRNLPGHSLLIKNDGGGSSRVASTFNSCSESRGNASIGISPTFVSQPAKRVEKLALEADRRPELPRPCPFNWRTSYTLHRLTALGRSHLSSRTAKGIKPSGYRLVHGPGSAPQTMAGNQHAAISHALFPYRRESE